MGIRRFEEILSVKMSKALYLIGSGGLGREVYATLKACSFLNDYEEVSFIDSGEGFVNNVRISGNNDFLKNLKIKVDVIITISSCQVRKKIIDELSSFDHINFITFVHPKSSIYDASRVNVGRGVFIAEGTILTTDIKIGDFCFLSACVSLHHDVVLENNCFLMPGVRITGGAYVGKNTYLGTNYCVIDARKIEKNSKLVIV